MDTLQPSDNKRVNALLAITKRNPGIFAEVALKYPTHAKVVLMELLKKAYIVESFQFIEELLATASAELQAEFAPQIKARIYQVLAKSLETNRSAPGRPVIGKQQALRTLELIKNDPKPQELATSLQREILKKEQNVNRPTSQQPSESSWETMNDCEQLELNKFLFALQWNDFATFITIRPELCAGIVAADYQEFESKAARIFHFFVGRGADLLRERKHRLFLAWLVEETKLEKLLARESLGNSTLHYAAFSNDYRLLDFLICEVYGHSKARINSKNLRGVTPLHAATAGVSYRSEASNDKWRSVELLLGKGALWQIKDLLGATAADNLLDETVRLQYHTCIAEHCT